MEYPIDARTRTIVDYLKRCGNRSERAITDSLGGIPVDAKEKPLVDKISLPQIKVYRKSFPSNGRNITAAYADAGSKNFSDGTDGILGPNDTLELAFSDGVKST